MLKIAPTIILMICFLACKDNQEERLKKEIIGKWKVVKSELNNKPSKSMENAFFFFKPDNLVETNVFEEKDVVYSLEGNRLTMKAQQPLEMDISYLESDSLVMEGNYTLYFIKFFMKRDVESPAIQ